MAENKAKKQQREQIADQMLQDKKNGSNNVSNNNAEKSSEKSTEQYQNNVETIAKELSQEDLINALNIPVENDGKDREEIDQDKIVDEPEFENVESSVDNDDDDFSFDDEDLNFGEDMGSSLENEMFEDSDLMAEIGVELIDLLIVNGCQAIAKDWGNEDKYSVSDRKKAKLKKPLAQLLRKKGTKIEPEYIFGVMVLVMYAPKVIEAVQQRKANKQKAQEQPQPEPIELPTNPRFPRPAFAPPLEVVEPQPQPQPQPQPEPKTQPTKRKRAGRPKGSKDSKPRKTDGYKKTAVKRK